ncbi:MAG: NapC/NirT family cytochrome c [Leptospirillia bacterium]
MWALTLSVLAAMDVLLIIAILYGWVAKGAGRRKLLAFLVLGVFPLLWGTAAFSYNFNRIKDVEFCATCHAMQDHVRSLQADSEEPLSALHYQNNFVPQETACYFCHTGYTWFGPLKGKFNGIRHIYVAYIQGVPDKLSIYEPYQNRDCLQCHGKSKRFRSQPVHNRRADMMDNLQNGTFSCLTEGCHDLAHLLPEDW